MKIVAWRLLVSLFLLTGIAVDIWGQCIEIEGDQVPTVNCGDAPETCLQNACYGTVNVPFVGFQGFCGPMTIINNPQFFAFTPLDTFASIEIRVTSCDGSGNSALQSAIIPGCDWTIDSVLVCDAGTPVGGTMVMSYDQFVPNQTYYLLIDGSNGAVCQYEITSVTNVFEPDINETLDNAFPDEVTACQGQDSYTVTANPALQNANYYSWSMPWGEEVSGSNILDVEVPEDAPLGTFTVEVYAYSGCDTVDMPWPTFQMEIVAVDDVDKAPFTFCPEDLPYAWGNQTINAPGTYTITVDNDAGCPYDSIWQVDVYPDVPVEEIDTVHCGIDLEYEGVTYSADGTYPLQYPGLGLNGCDSAANLNVVLIDLEGTLDFNCVNGEFVIAPTNVIYQPANATLDYEWFNGGVLIPNETLDNLSVVADGNYTVQITVSANGSGCSFELGPVDIVVEEEVPAAPEIAHGDTLICPNAEAVFEIINQDPSVIEYIWAAPGNVIVNNDGSGTAIMDFVNADQESQVCISALNECGEGEQTCFIVELIQLPTVGIQVPNNVCQGEEVNVVFDGEASNFAEFVWNFGADADPATGTGEGPFDVSWSSPGQKIISVQVAEVGCDTIATDIVIDVEGVAQPVVNCISTIGSITFSWDPVPGADEYIVQIEGQSPIMTTDTFNTTTGLNPGDSLTISVISVSPGMCESTAAVFGCSAQNCPPPTIELSGVDTICLNNYAGPYSLYAIVNGDTTSGTWTGPGIIDGVNGIFDPLDPTAGPGQHPLTFQYTDMNNCTSQRVLPVVVLDSIQPLFTMEDVICVTDISNVSYTGNASPAASYTWQFDNATIQSGADGGPYTLSWDTPGMKQVSLTVQENGCTSELYSRMIEVKPELQSPTYACTPNTTSVQFDWTPDPNADSVNVFLIQGPAGMQTGNQILFENLNPGDTIIIEFVTYGDGTCPDLRDTATCISQDCPPATIVLSGADTVCLDQNMGAIPLFAVVNGDSVSGTWSGPGIVDPVNGLFNPADASAGPGQHMIDFVYADSNGCFYPENMEIIVYDIIDPGFTLDSVICISGDAQLQYTGGASAAAEYTWTFDNANILSGSGQGPYTLSWDTPGTKQVTLTVRENGCLSDLFSATIEVKPLLQSPLVSCMPTTSSVQFDWQPDPNADSLGVHVIQGSGGTFNGNQILFDNLNPGDSILIEFVTFGDGTCPDLRDTALCIAQDCPQVSVQIDSVPPFCLENSLLPFNLSVDIQNGNGSGTWSGTGITDGTAGSFDPQVAGVGVHPVTYTYLDQGCTFNDQISITIFEVPTADISDMGLVLDCANGNQLMLDGSSSSPAAGLSYAWSTADGNIISDPAQPLITVAAPGTYQLSVATPDGCTDSTTVVVTQDADVPVADAGPDQVITCARDTVILGGSSSTGSGIVYLWSTADGSILSDPTLEDIVVNAPGTYELVVSDTTNSCTATDLVLVTEDLAIPQVNASVMDILDCDTESVTIFGEADANGAPLRITWTTADGNIVSGGMSEQAIVNRPGTYTMIVENLENGCVDSISVMVMADDNIIQSLDFEVAQISCFGETDGSIVITSITGGQPPFAYAWNTGSADSLLQDLSDGAYTLTITDANGCTTQQTFTITEPPPLVVSAVLQPDPNATFFEGDTAEVILSDLPDLLAIDSIIWSGGSINGFCRNEPSCRFTVMSSTTVSVVVVDTNGCVATDQVDIRVIIPRRVFVPNVFTPNEDSQNDFFTVFATENVVQLSSFRIYNRWGEVVFERDAIAPNIPELGWDGMVNGENALPGVYIYSVVIEYDDGVEEVVKGDLTLLR